MLRKQSFSEVLRHETVSKSKNTENIMISKYKGKNTLID